MCVVVFGGGYCFYYGVVLVYFDGKYVLVMFGVVVFVDGGLKCFVEVFDLFGEYLWKV